LRRAWELGEARGECDTKKGEREVAEEMPRTGGRVDGEEGEEVAGVEAESTHAWPAGRDGRLSEGGAGRKVGESAGDRGRMDRKRSSASIMGCREGRTRKC
jgi:hypothetical protein